MPAGGAAAGAELSVGVRPEHLTLAPRDGALALPLVVSQVEQLGGHALLYGMLPDGSTAVTAQIAGQYAGRVDDALTVYAPPEACHFFDAQGLRLGAFA
jgi:multiple sugar transport system ATP-binding protein